MEEVKVSPNPQERSSNTRMSHQGRLVTLFTGQWGDVPLEQLCEMAQSFGYEGLELAATGDHLDISKAATDVEYAKSRKEIPARYGLQVVAISNHMVGQAVCDLIDERHRSILPVHVWGDGQPEGVRTRAAQEMKLTALAAHNIGVKIVTGFTGSSIWHLLYSFPPVPAVWIEQGYTDFAKRWTPILDTFDTYDVDFAFEVHPTEIAFDISTAEKALKAISYHKRFCFNFDPSHFAYQNVDYVLFIRKFGDRIRHVHMKDVYVAPTPKEAGTFGGYVDFGDYRRSWNFRSVGRGSIKWEEIIRALNDIQYSGPLSVEWEDTGMVREYGAKEACAFVKKLDFPPSSFAFDSNFARKTLD